MPNHLTQTASGKLLGVVLLPSGWDGDIRVSDEGLQVLIMSVTPNLMRNAEMLLAQQRVDGQTQIQQYTQHKL